MMHSLMMLALEATLGIQQLVNQFAKGDRYARRDLFQYSAMLGVDLQAKELIAEALGTSDQAIVDAFLQRQRPSAAAPADTHVKAPPDLLDDDTAKAEPGTATAVLQPNKPAKATLEPLLDENGKPLPNTDRRYIQAMREHRLAQLKKDQEGE
jgi:hypothetical protein